jgi:hypothetical protein
MQDDDRPTCGKGVAANAVLPATLAELMAARADVLEHHTKALDPADPAARQELDAYNKLVEDHRRVADELVGLARQMASYGGLLMGRHDFAVMSDPSGQPAAFRSFVEFERQLLRLLQNKLEEDDKLLR